MVYHGICLRSYRFKSTGGRVPCLAQSPDRLDTTVWGRAHAQNRGRGRTGPGVRDVQPIRTQLSGAAASNRQGEGFPVSCGDRIVWTPRFWGGHTLKTGVGDAPGLECVVSKRSGPNFLRGVQRSGPNDPGPPYTTVSYPIP